MHRADVTVRGVHVVRTLRRSPSSWSRYAWMVGNNLDAIPCTRCTRHYRTGSREQWVDWKKRETDRVAGCGGGGGGGGADGEEAWIRTPRHICTSSQLNGFCSTEADIHIPDDQIGARTRTPPAASSCVEPPRIASSGLRHVSPRRTSLSLHLRQASWCPTVSRAGACSLPRKRQCHNQASSGGITRERARGIGNHVLYQYGSG